jgi:hypothetical protein
VDLRLDTEVVESYGNESLYSMLTWLQCPRCNYLSRRDSELLESKAPCPHCGAREEWDDWPPDTAWYYFLRLREAFVEDASNEMTILETCVFLETLFECFLYDLLSAKRVSEDMAEIILDEIHSVSRRQGLYKKLTRSKLRQDIKDLAIDYEHFCEDWLDDIVPARNRHIHGRFPDLSYELAEKAFMVALCSFEVFARLSNKYCLKDQR